ncbi:MAG: hypothetical protein Q8K89_01920, partial [Actinomycetota bacterium]|nr:hypothetical protein [Actinomycetota bacterium]
GDPVGKVDPTGLGYRDVWVQNWNSLNSAEKALAKSWRATQLLSYYNASKAALKRAQAKFPGWALKNDKADAFRHAYWNAALSRLIGRKSAKVWTDAHETGAVGQPWREKSMDLHNNFVGRDVSSTYWSLQMTGGRDNVEGRILSSGRLWWFGNGV